MSDFIVPPVEEQPKVLSPKEASSEAFYAAATSSENPVDDYKTAKADLELNGSSAFVDMARDAWKKEQDVELREVVGSIITDKSVSDDEKRAILSTYAATGYIQPSLKDKYILQQASRQIGPTQGDIEAQNAVVAELEARNKTQKVKEIKEQVEKAADGMLTHEEKQRVILEGSKGVAAAVTDVLVGIPASLAKVYTLIVDKDVKKANELREKIQKWAYSPEGAEAQKARMDVLTTLAKLSPWAEEIEAKVRKKGIEGGKRPDWEAELVAMGAAAITDPINIAGLFLLGKSSGNKPILEVPADSPASVTQMANPQAAEKMGASAIADKTGQLAEAIGTDKGSVIHDWVLSKPLPDSEQSMHPDLVKELNRMDAEARGVFQEYRYDPNLINATKREEEVSRVWEVIHESRGPTYQQANSTIIETDNVFEGKAIYGRNSSSGYLRENDAVKAKEKLEASLATLPEEFRGTVEIVKDGSEHYIQHTWKKEYDELGARVFGPDAVKTSIFGIPASGLARMPGVGRWLFPTGWAPTWVEQGAGRGIARTAVIEKKFVKELEDKITTLAKSYGKEMTILRDEAAELGKDYYSPAEISAKFPYLNTKQVNDVFEGNVYHRRMQEYNYNFFNRLERSRLHSDGMQGLFDKNGNFVGPATKAVPDSELDGIKQIWSMDTQNVLDFTPQLRIRQDKQVVRLHSPIITEAGEKFNYALVGTEHKLGMLPRETLPRTPGYSPRRVKENWYVDVIPTKLKVDGNDVTDPKLLEAHVQTKAADRTEAGANKAAAEIQSLYPDHKVVVRPERQDNFGQVVSDYKVYNELYRHSMKRGDRLPSSNGQARIEDYLLSELNTVKSLSRMEAFKSWDETFQKAFVKQYGDFLPKYQFPMLKTDIVPRPNMGRDLQKQYQNAHRLFDFYARQKNFETLGDFLWKRGMYGIADVLEKIKIPAEFLRELGKLGNPIMQAKKVTTVAFIHLFPQRQWVIQPAQMHEINAINPVNGIRNMTMLPTILMDLGADAKMMAPMRKTIQFFTDKMAKAGHKTGGVSPEEYKQILAAIKKSGIVESVDMNSIVHGVFHNAETSFVPTTWEKAQTAMSTGTGYGLVKKGVHLSRNVGFDPAQITNDIGIWLQTRSQWIDENPGSNWNTKENIETISHESWRRAGNMTRAGNLPYQEGALSIVFQFAAIQQKMLMNLLQDTATTMTAAQRGKLAALRLGTYGVKYGLPGGALVYYFTDQYGDEETKAVMNHPVVRRGLMDYAVNGVIASTVYPEDPPDLALSKSFSPYSEAFLPMLDVLHSTWLALDEQPVTKPRLPIAGFASSFGKAMEDMQGWWVTRDVNEESYKMMFMEAAELASGFNSYWQGQLMLGMEDKVSRMGNKYGVQITKEEAIAKMMAGIPSQKEEDLFLLMKNETEKKKQIKDKAKEIHTQLMNQAIKTGSNDYEAYGRRLNSFMSVLDPKYFNEMDKYQMMEEITKLDKYSYQETRQSLFASIWQRWSTQMTQDRIEAIDIMRRSNLPQAKEIADKLEKGEL